MTLPLTRRTPLPQPSGLIHVLLVDDHPDVRLAIAWLLQLSGVRIGEAGTGREALAYLARNPDVEVVITDLYMPGSDGLELITAVRQMRLPRPALIAISGRIGLDAAVESAAILSADAYLAKPVMRLTLLATIRSLLGPERSRHLTD